MFLQKYHLESDGSITKRLKSSLKATYMEWIQRQRFKSISK